MPMHPLVITFPERSAAEGGRLAESLADALRDLDPSIEAERRSDRPDTQDLGATLAVILAAPAVAELAKGLASWLARNSGVRIEVSRNGKIILSGTHLDSKDVPGIVAALSNDR
jgi:hypothetical protein